MTSSKFHKRTAENLASLLAAARRQTLSRVHGLKLQRLKDFESRILSQETLHQALDLTIREVLESTTGHSAILFILDQEGNLVQQYGRSRVGEILDEPLLRKKGITRQIQISGRPLVISGEDGKSREKIPAYLRKSGIDAMLGLPLKRGTAPAFGVLYVRYSDGRVFDPGELDWLDLLAGRAAFAIEYLRLLEENRRRELDLGVMVDTAHLLNSTLDMEKLLQQIAVRLSWLTGMNSCTVSTFIRNPDRVRTAAEYTANGETIADNLEHVYYLEDYPLIRKVLENNEPHIVHIHDADLYPNEVGLLHKQGDATLLMLPLKAGGEPVGLLEFYSKRSDYYIAPADIKRLHALSEQVALVLVNARHYHEEQRARLTAETLRQATAALTSTLELKQVLDLILEQLQQVVYFDSASLMLLEDEAYNVVAVHGHPCPEEALSIRTLLCEDDLAWQVITHKESVIISDAQKDPRFLKLANTGYVRGWMGVPLITRGNVIGLLTVDNRQPNAYTEADAKMALTFAGQAALAVTNARLYQSEHEHRSMAEALGEISLALLSSSLDSGAVLKILLEQIGRVVPYDSACVMMLEGGNVRITTHRGFEPFGVDNLDDFLLPVNETPNLQYIADTLRPHFISNVSADEGWVHTESAKHIRSWVGAPLVGRERLLGFLSLDKVQPGFYTAEHASNLAILAAHASLALLNAFAFREVEQASITDFITNSYNHRYFQQQLRSELERAQVRSRPLSLLMIDLDHFKQVNDTYGHLFGDQVLKSIAGRLKEELRTTDILSRYGGEEFAVILPGSNLAGARTVAERLREAVQLSPVLVEDKEIHVTVSIGVAAHSDQANEAQTLIWLADKALYQSKNSGRNQVCLADE